MYLKMTRRLLRETDKRLLWKLIWNLGFKGLRSVQKHQRRLKRGECFPPFLYVSIINSCNLRCQGCWIDVAAKQEKIELDAMNRLIAEAKQMGNSFFGILGGEPFMHPELMAIMASHPDCYFQVLTNGHFVTDQLAKQMRRLGNVSPLVSVEGTEIVSDLRRGGSNVLSRTMEGLDHCLNNRLLTGVCTSLCQTNLDDLLTDEWIDRLIEMGVMITWFYVYRPVGPDARPDLALTAEQQLKAREFVVRTRATKPIIVIDAYYDDRGQALCPSATGFSHHINPWGGIEPCPVIQLATESVHDHRPLREVFKNSAFLNDYRQLAATHTRGCMVLERPDLLKKLAEKHGARDSTARGTVIAELEAMRPRPSQYNPGREIPESNLAYRLAKRLCFNDFGLYDKHFRTADWKDPRRKSDKTRPRADDGQPYTDPQIA